METELSLKAEIEDEENQNDGSIIFTEASEGIEKIN